MLEILTVCTGNVCRSPIAQQLLQRHLDGLAVRFGSAGTRARDGMRMTPEAAEFATWLGVPQEMTAVHQARVLTDHRLASVDLALAMARDHRREIVELNPTFLRKTFTIRELHRLVGSVSDHELISSAMCGPGTNPHQRLTAILAFVASLRGIVPPPQTADVDDVVDPYGRSRRTYEISVAQISEAVPSVERVLRLAMS